MRYRKKPIVIEAIQFDGTNFDELHKFCGNVILEPVGEIYIEIETLEGRMKANVGDFIIRGVNGEFYPCNYDIFNKTYEFVDYDIVEEEQPCVHQHTKIYDKSILMSNPPKRNWTCALCGVKGSDWVESALDSIMFQNGSSMETIPGNTPIRGKAKT